MHIIKEKKIIWNKNNEIYKVKRLTGDNNKYAILEHITTGQHRLANIKNIKLIKG